VLLLMGHEVPELNLFDSEVKTVKSRSGSTETNVTNNKKRDSKRKEAVENDNFVLCRKTVPLNGRRR
jgi:hypothetical protein